MRGSPHTVFAQASLRYIPLPQYTELQYYDILLEFPPNQSSHPEATSLEVEVPAISTLRGCTAMHALPYLATLPRNACSKQAFASGDLPKACDVKLCLACLAAT